MRVGLLCCLVGMASSACGQTGPTVTGTLVEEGGPTPGVSTPTSGNIRMSGPTGTFSATAGHDGTFSLQVPAGTYSIEGRPSTWPLSGYPCGGQQVTLVAGKTMQTTVVCSFP